MRSISCKLIKDNPKKFFSSEFLFISAAFLCLNHFLLSYVQAGGFQLVHSLSKECFNSRERQTCLNAIEQIEEFQLISGSQENYSCQTRLLGLESKLIMVLLNKHKNRSHLNTLKEVHTYCD